MDSHIRPPSASGRLRKNCLNFWEVLAQSIALISPTMTASLIVPAMFATAGNGSWLAYAFAMVMLLFVALCLNEFARRSTTSGSMYAYVTRGMGPVSGGLAGWSLIWAYLFIGMAGMTGFTNFGQVLLGMMGVTAGHVNDIGTVIALCGICMFASWYCAYKDVRLSAILMLLLEVVSVALILVLTAVVLFHKGLPVDHGQMSLNKVTFSMIGFGVVIAIFSQVGFEAASAFGEEAKQPLINIPKAVIWSLITTGLFFVVVTYMEVYGTHGYKTTLDQLTAPLNTLSEIVHMKWMAVPLSIGAMVSFFSLNLSCLNSGARILFKMGHHKMFHESVGQSHSKNETPHVAINIVSVIMMAVVTGISIWHNTPHSLKAYSLTSAGCDTDVFGWVGTFGAFGFLGGYFLVTIAAPMYLKQIGELKAKNIAISVIGVLLLMVPAVGSVYTNPPLTPPVKYFPYIFLAYFAIGWISCLRLRGRGTEVIEGVKQDLDVPAPTALQMEPS
ncbi:MAG: APC family permease [Capsulimonadaceae bacterium]